MKKLKVWGGTYYGRETQFRTSRAVIAGYSKKQIAELAGVSLYGLNGYWCETGNKEELSIAIEPGMWIFDHRGNLVKRLK